MIFKVKKKSIYSDRLQFAFGHSVRDPRFGWFTHYTYYMLKGLSAKKRVRFTTNLDLE